MEYVAMAQLYVATYGWQASIERIFESKSFRAYLLGFLVSVFFCGTMFMLMTPAHAAVVKQMQKHQQKRHDKDSVNTTVTGFSCTNGTNCMETDIAEHLSWLAITGIVLAAWIPLAGVGYFAYTRGYLDKCLAGSGRDDSSREEKNSHRRCTVDMHIEMASRDKNQFAQLFDDQGRLCSNLMESQDSVTEISNAASSAPSSSTGLGKWIKSEVNPFQVAGEDDAAAKGDGTSFNSAATEAVDDEVLGEASRSTRKKKTGRHNFAVKAQDQEKAQAAAQARVERRTEKAEKKSEVGEGKVNTNVKVGDGVALGCKFGPGLVVTGIQADSAMAKWNESNPLDLVVEGAKVISINGTTTPTDMLKLTRSKEAATLDIWFQLPTPKVAKEPPEAADGA